ncbi:MAG TPA: transglutaminase-like cysteine peptidase [Rhizomicrobium sp.]
MRSVSILKMMVVGLLLMAPTIAFANSVFKSGIAGSHGFLFFPFWQQVLTDMAAAQPNATFVATRTGPAQAQPCANERTCIPAAWISFLDGIRNKPRLAQLNAVNLWANAKPYVEDWAGWRVADYWETPGEFLARGGDCEDYAITKYFSLVRLGFSPDDLRIVIVNDTNLNVFHAVLVARVEGGIWLLDNQLQQTVPMDIAVQYVPVYSLNERGWWIHSVPKIKLGNVTIAAGGAN